MSNKEIALAKENERLRRELQSFDSNFWEELEDMKYRYSGLQAAVGSDNLQAAHSKLVAHAGPVSRRRLAVQPWVTTIIICLLISFNGTNATQQQLLLVQLLIVLYYTVPGTALVTV